MATQPRPDLGMVEILAVQCGGAIDKDYPSKLYGYNFEVASPSVERIVAMAVGSSACDPSCQESAGPAGPTAGTRNPNPAAAAESVPDVDSNRSAVRVVSIYDSAVENGYATEVLAQTVAESATRRVLVTHDLPSIVSGATRLASALEQRRVIDAVVVFTGARIPERFRQSDAAVNVGVAIGALRSPTVAGVYISAGCLIIPAAAAVQAGIHVKAR